MSVFDFLANGASAIKHGLFGGDEIVPGQAATDTTAAVVPSMGHSPGLFDKLGARDDEGISFWDRLGAMGAGLRDNADPGLSQSLLDTQRKAYAERQALVQKKADHAKKNAAFKAAYQNGRFDPAVYAANIGDADVDPLDIVKTARELAPQGGVDGGVSYTRDPLTGATVWGDQRPESHAEAEAARRDAETTRYHDLLDAISRGKLDVSQQNAETSSYRAHKGGGGGGGGLPALPNGFVVEK